jgi:hypothetical protein
VVYINEELTRYPFDSAFAQIKAKKEILFKKLITKIKEMCKYDSKKSIATNYKQ